MSKLKELDIILGEALEHANDSARVIRECSEIQTKDNLYRVGHAINNLWEIREQIYSVCPELKQEFVSEFESDENRFNELSKLHSMANQAEENNKPNEAISLYKELLQKSVYGHYKRLAEAGLYRVGTKS
jgi:hypothetical protein